MKTSTWIKVAVVVGIIVAGWVIHSLPRAAEPEEYEELVASADNGAIQIFVTNEPCAPEILETLPEPVRPFFKGGRSIWYGEKFKSCWIYPGGMDVLVISDDGTQTPVPHHVFGPPESFPALQPQGFRI